MKICTNGKIEIVTWYHERMKNNNNIYIIQYYNKSIVNMILLFSCILLNQIQLFLGLVFVEAKFYQSKGVFQ